MEKHILHFHGDLIRKLETYDYTGIDVPFPWKYTYIELADPENLWRRHSLAHTDNCYIQAGLCMLHHLSFSDNVALIVTI